MGQDLIRSINGMNDCLPEQVCEWQNLEATCRELFESYGFAEIRTPILEQTALFKRGIGENTQVVQKEMYTFNDLSGDSLTLRPEGTASVVRAYLQHNLSATDSITKVYYMGPMFRHERPQKGRLRQFHQIGCELFGTESPEADAEVMIMMDRLWKKLGLKDYQLEVNSLGTIEERQNYIKALVSFFEPHQNVLGEEDRKRLVTNPLRVLDSKDPKVQELAVKAPKILDHLTPETRAEFDLCLQCLTEAGVSYVINPSIVRGLDYYEKTAFEFTSNLLGAQATFGAGGRYNKLVSELGGAVTPAVGFALGCERVLLMREALNLVAPKSASGVYVITFDDNGAKPGRQLVQKIRDAGLRAERGYESKSMKAQMRRANKLGFKYVAILGDDEIKQSSVALKNLETSEQNIVSWDDVVKSLK